MLEHVHSLLKGKAYHEKGVCPKGTVSALPSQEKLECPSGVLVVVMLRS